jgi:hypothetical protein
MVNVTDLDGNLIRDHNWFIDLVNMTGKKKLKIGDRFLIFAKAIKTSEGEIKLDHGIIYKKVGTGKIPSKEDAEKDVSNTPAEKCTKSGSKIKKRKLQSQSTAKTSKISKKEVRQQIKQIQEEQKEKEKADKKLSAYKQEQVLFKDHNVFQLTTLHNPHSVPV